MDVESTELTELSFGKEIAKAFVITTAQAAGMYVGFGLVLAAAGKILKVGEIRKAKKTQS